MLRNADVTEGDVYEKIDDATIALVIPRGGRLLSVLRPKRLTPCYRFQYSIIGGSVSAYLHAEDPETYVGRRTKVRVELWKRRRTGCSEMYLCLEAGEHAVKHRMCVTGSTDIPRAYRGRHTRVHRVPGLTMTGMIIFTER